MNRLSIFLVALCLPLLCISQDMEDKTFDWTRDLQSKLSLNIIEAQETDIILNDYNEKLTKLIKEDGDNPDRTFEAEYAVLKSARNKKLDVIFDKQQMTLFNKMEMGMVENIKDYYQKLVMDLGQNAGFREELAAYQTSNQVPVILEQKESLIGKIDEDDQMELMQLGTQFKELLAAAVTMQRDQNQDFSTVSANKMFKVVGKANPGYKPVWKRIKALSKKYSEQVTAEYLALDRHRPKWNAGIKSILQKHIPYEEHKQLDNLFFILTHYGISRRISQISFLLFDKDQVDNYFEVQRSGQELFVKNTL